MRATTGLLCLCLAPPAAFAQPALKPVALDKVAVGAQPTPTRTPTPVHIGNLVWDDLDGDGVQDAGEPGLAGVSVQLWNPAKTQMIASAVTNGSGNYTVVAPLPGSYRLRVLLPNANDTFSPKDAAGEDTKDSDVNPSGPDTGFTDVIVIASNVISMTNVDAGIRRAKIVHPGQIPTTAPPTPTPAPVPTPNKGR